jgi:hypothetical protein
MQCLAFHRALFQHKTLPKTTTKVTLPTSYACFPTGLMDEYCVPPETEGETAQDAGGTNRNVEYYKKFAFLLLP